MEATVFGDKAVLEGMDDSDVLVDTSTISPTLSSRVAERARRLASASSMHQSVAVHATQQRGH